MNKSNLISAFLLSPLAATFFLAVWGALSLHHHSGRTGQAIGVLLVLYGLFCYVATVVLGVPLFFAYRRFRISSPASYALGGALIGVAFSVILLLSGYGVSQGVALRVPDVIICAIAGGISGFVFRLMINRRGISAPVAERR
jgi:hypothetical protein